MTKEEALKKLDSIKFQINYCYDDYGIHYEDAKELINNIFNDFENRICKNCKFYKNGVCYEDEPYSLVEVNEDFGCNKFERREND